jgi:ABC-type proline/glycine betaine transport system ATPase subunit
VHELTDATPLLADGDRIVAMDSGRVLAQGTPAEVIADPLVLESYLRGSAVAVERSGAGLGTQADPQRCAATTRSGSPCRRTATQGAYRGQHAAGLVAAR